MTKKTCDNLTYPFIGTFAVVMALLLVSSCDRPLENPVPKENVNNIGQATDIYEVEFDGVKYIVVQTHKGVGVCAKPFCASCGRWQYPKVVHSKPRPTTSPPPKAIPNRRRN